MYPVPAKVIVMPATPHSGTNVAPVPAPVSAVVPGVFGRSVKSPPFVSVKLEMPPLSVTVFTVITNCVVNVPSEKVSVLPLVYPVPKAVLTTLFAPNLEVAVAFSPGFSPTRITIDASPTSSGKCSLTSVTKPCDPEPSSSAVNLLDHF